jgi:hypothetical protein
MRMQTGGTRDLAGTVCTLQTLTWLMAIVQLVKELLRQIRSGQDDEKLFAAHRLASLLEVEEAKYRAVVGDPHGNQSLRNHYGIGKLLSYVKVSRCYQSNCTCW